MGINGSDDWNEFIRLVYPVTPHELAATLRTWLNDAHQAASALDNQRTDEHRGRWHNSTSFGTDRYQYLLHTAWTLESAMPVKVDHYRQALLLKLDQVALYPFRMEGPPHGTVRLASDLRRELLSGDEDTEVELALFSRGYAGVAGKELLLLPWSGSATGLDEIWAGRGELDDEHRIRWDWAVKLTSVGEGEGGRPLMAPVWPTAPDDPADDGLPELEVRPRQDRLPDVGASG